MAGIVVFVRRTIMRNFKRLNCDCTFGIFLEVDKHLFNLDHSIIMCFVYLPPEKSPFYRDYETEGVKLLENELLKLELVDKNDYLIIMGDLNARVAERSDYVNDNHIVPGLQDYEEYLLDDEIDKRVSCDKHVNKFGLALIQFCKTFMLQICNGRIDLDKHIGEFTFMGVNGNSVIDYAICSSIIANFVANFKIDDRTESSHFPVYVGLKCELMIDTSGNNPTNKNSYTSKYKFNENSIPEYQNNLSQLSTNEFVHSFILEIDNTTNSIERYK